MQYRTTGAAPSFLCGAAGADRMERIDIRPSARWATARLAFNGSDDRSNLKLAFVTGAGTLELRRLQLQRKMRHPFDSQLFFYLRQLVRLDFGVSTSTNQKVSTLLKIGVFPSLALTIPIFLATVVLAITAALVCAFFRNSLIDRGFVVVSVALMSVNYLVWIVVGQYLFAYKLMWFPIWGFESWRFLLLPVLIGVVSGLGRDIRFYRTLMLDEMYKDYVRTAFAKGVSRRGVLFRHVLKNAMIPIITDVVIAIPFLYTGSLLLENFFGIPGLGYIGIQAINSSDVDVVRALVLIGAVLYVIANLITDICYSLVDPRVRLQ
jgi:peptide/nickel transport system permease protein